MFKTHKAIKIIGILFLFFAISAFSTNMSNKEFLVKGRTAKPTRTYYSNGIQYVKGLVITKDDILLDENQKISNEYDNFEVVSKSKAMKFKDQELRTFKIV